MPFPLVMVIEKSHKTNQVHSRSGQPGISNPIEIHCFTEDLHVNPEIFVHSPERTRLEKAPDFQRTILASILPFSIPNLEDRLARAGQVLEVEHGLVGASSAGQTTTHSGITRNGFAMGSM